MKTKKLTIFLLATIITSTSPISGVRGDSYLDSGYFYSTFFGGSDNDRIRDVALDSEGNIIVTGGTWSDDFPVLDAAQREYGGGELPPGEYFHLNGDSFVAKFTPDYRLIWSTYLGGSGYELATHVEIDNFDNIIIIGHTTSQDFPLIEDVAPYNLEEGDPFITVYAPGGEIIQSLRYAPDEIGTIEHTEMDSEGNLVIVGYTSSPTMYCSEDAFQTTLAGDSDGYIHVVSSDLESVLFSTYIGGSGEEYIGEVAVGKDNSIYVSGTTHSEDLPVTPNCIRSEYMGNPYDNFIGKISPSRDLVTLTYFGGSDIDHIFGLCEGPHGDAIAFVGRTWSPDLPVTENAFMSQYRGEADGFLTVIDDEGTDVLFSSYYGLEAWDSILQINMDEYGKLITTGFVHSGGFETVNAFQSEYKGSSEVVISIWGEAIELNSYLGGYSQEHALAQVIQDGKMFVVGDTASPEFEVLDEAFQTSLAGGEDGYLWVMDYRGYIEGDYIPEPSGPDYRPYTSLGAVLGTIALWFVVIRKMFSQNPSLSALTVHTRYLQGKYCAYAFGNWFHIHE
jgi:hypothetical protein